MNTVYKFNTQPLHPDYMKLRTAGLQSKKSAMFGMVRVGKDGKPRAHQGIDLAINPGYKCYAVEDATVAYTADYGAYGKQVCLKLKSGIYAFYAHLSEIRVTQGQEIKEGHVIGLTGHSGNAESMTNESRGSHLHFEVRVTQRPGLGLGGRLDPMQYVTLTEDKS